MRRIIRISSIIMLTLVVGNAIPILFRVLQSRTNDTNSPMTGQGGCASPQICDATAAISRALEFFPEGHTYHSWIVKPMSLEHALNWRHATMNASDIDAVVTPDPYGEQAAWLVGALASNLTVSDYGLPSSNSATVSIAGMWAVLVASNGSLNSMGGLEPQSSNAQGGGSGTGWYPLNYASLQSVPTEILPIVTTTPIPTLTPGPAPTSDW